MRACDRHEEKRPAMKRGIVAWAELQEGNFGPGFGPSAPDPIYDIELCQDCLDELEQFAISFFSRSVPKVRPE